MTTSTITDALWRYEVARRVLGHAATLTSSEIGTLAGKRQPSEVLTGYASALEERCHEQSSEYFPDPVLPSVDTIGLRVEHTTCTGRTRLLLQCEDGAWTVVLHRLGGDPLDGSSGRDVALAVLADRLDGLGARASICPSERAIVRAVAILACAWMDDDGISALFAGAAGRIRPAQTVDVRAAWAHIAALEVPGLLLGDRLYAHALGARAYLAGEPDRPLPQLDPELERLFRLWREDGRAVDAGLRYPADGWPAVREIAARPPAAWAGVASPGEPLGEVGA